MKTIAVASENPVKIDAVRLGFERMFPGETFNTMGVGVHSGVSDQPMTDQAALKGATTRAKNAAKRCPWGELLGGD